jgi:hypothetical protein
LFIHLFICVIIVWAISPLCPPSPVPSPLPSVTKKNEISCHLQVNGWNWRISSQVKLARLRRPKILCPPSYVDYRPKTNAVILLDMGHTLKGEHIHEE